jgi:holo-[acyl-carrier protein] synthase
MWAMIVGIGVDLLEVDRVERELCRDAPSFLSQLFSPREISHARALRHPARHYAGRFAAKEAVFKALGADGLTPGSFREVEVHPTPSGPEEVILHGRLKSLAEGLKVRRINLSISHSRTMAAAGVVLES